MPAQGARTRKRKKHSEDGEALDSMHIERPQYGETVVLRMTAGSWPLSEAAVRDWWSTPAQATIALDAKKATVAVAHSILVVVYHLLERGEPYNELGGDYFIERQQKDAYHRRPVKQLERMG